MEKRGDLSILQPEALWQENGTLFAERSRVFFPIKPEEWSQALGRIRRLRNSRNWKRIGTSDIYWTATFLAALVDTVDSYLHEEPEIAFQLSLEGILVAERIRPIDCPGGGELGKRSLRAWAYSVHGSTCRAVGQLPEAEQAFQSALALVGKQVLDWSAAETWRRYAVLFLSRRSLTGLEYVDRAIAAYAGFPHGQADCWILRGAFHFFLCKNHSLAVSDTSMALQLVEAKRSPREARSWFAAIQNLGVYYARGTSDLPAIALSLKRVRQAGEKLTRHEPFRRMYCLWIQGLLLGPLGATRKAARLISKAGNWMRKNGHLIHAGLCSLDLAILHFRAGEMITTRTILESLLPEELDPHPQIQKILAESLERFWAQEVSESSLAQLREAVEFFTVPGARRTLQPLGMKMGANSSSGSSPEAELATG